jgi:circadian clock protein KaiC
VLIDSLRDLEIATPDKVRYRDYVYSLVEDFKRHGITTLITNEIAQLFGEFQLSEHGISFIADNVILLRYVELEGRISRALSILKMRGSFHDKTIRELLISNQGIAIGEPIKALTGILTGTPVLNESFPLTELSPRSRYVLAILRSIGPASAADMETQTGLWHDQLTQELDHLLQNGLVETAGTDGIVSFYKATV